VVVIAALAYTISGAGSSHPPPAAKRASVEAAPPVTQPAQPVPVVVPTTPSPQVTLAAPSPSTTPSASPSVAVAEVKPSPLVLDKPEPVTQAAPSPVTPSEDYATLVERSRSLLNRGQIRLAIAPLEQAIAKRPNGDEALAMLARCQLDHGALKKARDLAHLAIAANSSNGEAYLVMGAVEQAESHEAEARIDYEKYLKLSPKGEFAGEVRAILSFLR
jgi:Tfp pilus assembly protein PilF